MITPSVDTWADAQKALFTALKNTSSGEISNAQFEISNPRSRVSLSPTRATDYGFAAGFFMWNYRASKDLGELNYYNRRLAIDALPNLAHGYATRTVVDNESQWIIVTDALVAEANVRDAMMLLPSGAVIQFMIRDDRLHMRVSELQSDAVWGLCYNVFVFTLLQEVMLLDLKARMSRLELGTYVHSVGALWRAAGHRQLVDMVADEDPRQLTMPPITQADLGALVNYERALRERRGVGELAVSPGGRWLAERLLDHRLRRDAELRINASTIYA